MKLGILSDTHDNLPVVKRAVEVFNEANVSYVLHAGDLVSPFVDRALKGLKAPFIYVIGNNEGEIAGVYKLMKNVGEVHKGPVVKELGGKKVYLNHEPHCIESLAKSGDFDIIVYGHTHEIDVRTIGKTLIVNPGECSGWLTGRRTIAIVETDTMKAEIIDI
jgi:uncharacterized protein